MVSERVFQRELIEELRRIFPNAIILKNDPNYLQGFPDLTILVGSKFVLLEVKYNKNAHHRTNQEYYINLANEMGAYGAFIYPENKGKVLNEVQRALRPD